MVDVLKYMEHTIGQSLKHCLAEHLRIYVKCYYVLLHSIASPKLVIIVSAAHGNIMFQHLELHAVTKTSTIWLE